ncbi:MAG: cyclic pyranopterin monophosphate synthase [Candidatus Eremiobacteraeota bacterium]|nr:cyclic pyranopterin monophosphate synthase [Candidatus Eremiobacteraeota bacterium]
MSAPKPSHIAPDGSLTMVDVGAKASTARTARAEARVRLTPAAADALRAATLPKGDAFVAAQLAGIMAAKRTGELIPRAHPIPLGAVDVACGWHDATTLRIEARATTHGQTGVEMEALVAASIAALTVYDMCKALDKGIVVESVRLLEKTGGKSGDWTAS